MNIPWKPIRRRKRPRAKIDSRWERTREACCARAHEQCEECGRPAPLHATEDYPAGEGGHIERRWKSKEGKYDPANVRWLCGGMNGCHRREHREEEHDLCPPKV